MLSELRRHCRRDETGSSLILALIIVSILAIGSAAILSFADTSIRTTLGVRSQGSTAYAADGAVQAAINTIRNTSQGTVANGCPSVTTTVSGVTVRVDCTPLPGSGSAGDNGQGTTPPAAVITLGKNGTGVENDFAVINSNSDVTITGISSAQDITVQQSNAVLHIPTGTASAVLGSKPGCNLLGAGQILPSSAQNCGYPTITVTDPNYAPPPLPATTISTLPACDPKLVKLSPGIYTDSLTWPGGGETGPNALTALLTCGGSSGSIFWFQPGVYYFNFAAAVDDASPIYIHGSKASAYIAGAASSLWNPSSPNVNQEYNLAKNSGSCDRTQPGVEFVFGGYSRMGLKDGAYEFCPWFDPSQAATSPRISFYGVKDSSVPGYSSQAAGSCGVMAGLCGGTVNAWFNPQGTGGVGDPLYLTSWGTVYAPKASVVLNLPDQAAQPLFERGVISRIFQISRTVANGLASVSCEAAGIGCGAGPPHPRAVILKAYNVASGKLLLLAGVTFDDNNQTTWGQQVTVTAWSVYR